MFHSGRIVTGWFSTATMGFTINDFGLTIANPPMGGVKAKILF
jgi:hypothetical protein